MTQVSRLLKDLELISILASQLDTLLVKSLTLPSRSGSAALKVAQFNVTLFLVLMEIFRLI